MERVLGSEVAGLAEVDSAIEGGSEIAADSAMEDSVIAADSVAARSSSVGQLVWMEYKEWYEARSRVSSPPQWAGHFCSTGVHLACRRYSYSPFLRVGKRYTYK